MKLSDHQAAFTSDLAKLIMIVYAMPGYRVRLREVWRTKEQQKLYVEQGKSWTMKSLHLRGLAADLVLDIDGVYQRSTKAYAPLGFEWEKLSENNRWGGRFGDGNHFERRTEARSEPDLVEPLTA